MVEDMVAWELAPLPPGKKIVGWVYTVKIRPNGHVHLVKSSLDHQRIYTNFWSRSWFLFVSF